MNSIFVENAPSNELKNQVFFATFLFHIDTIDNDESTKRNLFIFYKQKFEESHL